MQGKGLDNWKSEKREDKSAARTGTDLLDQLGQLIKLSHRWSGLVSVAGLWYHSYQNSQPRTAEHWGVSHLSEHSMDVTWLQGPALQAELQSQQVSALWGTGCSNTHNLFHKPLVLLLHHTKDQWKEQCSGTQQLWRHEGQQLCLLFKAQDYTKWCGLVRATIQEPHILLTLDHPAGWWVLFWQLLCATYWQSM